MNTVLAMSTVTAATLLSMTTVTTIPLPTTRYTNKRTKFKIAGTVQKETPAEVEATHHAVEEDRKMYLQVSLHLHLHL